MGQQDVERLGAALRAGEAAGLGLASHEQIVEEVEEVASVGDFAVVAAGDVADGGGAGGAGANAIHGHIYLGRLREWLAKVKRVRAELEARLARGEAATATDFDASDVDRAIHDGTLAGADRSLIERMVVRAGELRAERRTAVAAMRAALVPMREQDVRALEEAIKVAIACGVPHPTYTLDDGSAASAYVERAQSHLRLVIDARAAAADLLAWRHAPIKLLDTPNLERGLADAAACGGFDAPTLEHARQVLDYVTGLRWRDVEAVIEGWRAVAQTAETTRETLHPFTLLSKPIPPLTASIPLHLKTKEGGGREPAFTTLPSVNEERSGKFPGAPPMPPEDKRKGSVDPYMAARKARYPELLPLLRALRQAEADGVGRMSVLPLPVDALADELGVKPPRAAAAASSSPAAAAATQSAGEWLVVQGISTLEAATLSRGRHKSWARACLLSYRTQVGMAEAYAASGRLSGMPDLKIAAKANKLLKVIEAELAAIESAEEGVRTTLLEHGDAEAALPITKPPTRRERSGTVKDSPRPRAGTAAAAIANSDAAAAHADAVKGIVAAEEAAESAAHASYLACCDAWTMVMPKVCMHMRMRA